MASGKYANSIMFEGISDEAAEAMFPCLDASEKTFAKGERIFRAGQVTEHLGIVLSGKVRVEVVDVWGDVAILESLTVGGIFAHGYACSKEPLDVDVVAETACTALLLKADHVIRPCNHICSNHQTLAANLMRALALRNLDMNRRAMATSPKTIRGKVMAYLSLQQQKAGTEKFTLPFSKTQLAGYLCVDRSALSAELSKMRKEGVIDFEGNTYSIL